MTTPPTRPDPPRASEVMARKLTCVEPATGVAEAVRLLLQYRISGMPVVDASGRFHGVFSDKSCLRVLTETAALLPDRTRKVPLARDFMVTRLLKLSPAMDSFEAISSLIRNRISGAPVVGRNGEFLGSFSEKSAMSAVLQTAYDQVPSAVVEALMDRDPNRLIPEDMDLLSVARVFIDTPFRRLVVTKGKKVLGQISRRDVLSSSRLLDTIVRHKLEQQSGDPMLSDDSILMLQAHEQLPSTNVSAFMHTTAETIGPDLDVISIAQIFLSKTARRLPVLERDKLVGQVSRRDVLKAIYQLTDPPISENSSTLYLSASRDREEMPVS
ncbi:MAG: CBS domain-containing protein [Planctomycetaceae bacterium]